MGVGIYLHQKQRKPPHKKGAGNMKNTNEIKFTKCDSQYYIARRGEKIVATIDICYNWYDHSHYYKVNGKQFNLLKDAKAFVRENL